ncbi:MAG: hypothetical protein GXP36_14515 [Actinobacteria bacterium]|nr:hypothetical protein [Actinomycetota bacterium]
MKKLNRFILDHPIVSVAVEVFVFGYLSSSVLALEATEISWTRVPIGDGPGWVAPTLVVWSVVGGGAGLLFHRIVGRQRYEIVGLATFVAGSGGLNGYGAVLLGAPLWAMYISMAVSLVALVALTVLAVTSLRAATLGQLVAGVGPSPVFLATTSTAILGRSKAWLAGAAVMMMFSPVFIPSSVRSGPVDGPSWLTWVALATVGVLFVGAVLVPRLFDRRADEVLAPSWGLVIVGYATSVMFSLLGAGIWLPGPTFIASVSAMALLTGRAKRSRPLERIDMSTYRRG